MKHSPHSNQSSIFAAYAGAVTKTSNLMKSAARYPTTRRVPPALVFLGTALAMINGSVAPAMSGTPDDDPTTTKNSDNEHKRGEIARVLAVQLSPVVADESFGSPSAPQAKRLSNHNNRCRSTNRPSCWLYDPKLGGPAISPPPRHRTWRTEGGGKNPMDTPQRHCEPRHRPIQSARVMSPSASPMRGWSVSSRIDVHQKDVCCPRAVRNSRISTDLTETSLVAHELLSHFVPR